MHVDLPTMYLALVVVAATLSLTTALSFSGEGSEGLRYWWASFAMHAAFYALVMLRGMASPILTVAVSNAALSSSFSILAEGLYRFQHRRPPRLLIWSPVVIVGVSFLFLLHQSWPRIVIAGVILSAQCLQILLALLQRRKFTAGEGQYIVAGGVGLTMVLMGLRLVLAMSRPPNDGPFRAPEAMEVATGLIGIACLILISHGLVFMVKDRADQRILALASQDPLTGLANRRRLDEALASEWARARRSRRPLALVMIDVDAFKAFNDAYGHQAGDACLEAVAGVLSATTRGAGDLAARFGGEEFLLMLPGADAGAARTIAEKIRASVEALNIPHSASPQGRVTISAGVAVMERNSHDQLEALLGDSDRALYFAKHNGRNQVREAVRPRALTLAS